MNTAATKIPKTHLLSFPNFLRKSSPSSPSSKTQMGFLAWYLGALESRPIITKSISSAIIYAAADVTSQMITMMPSDSLDMIRTLRMAGFGLIILGTAQHLWFNFMGRVLAKRDVVSTLKKLLIGQFAYGPLINSGFFSFNAALQGENGEEIAARLNRDLLPTMIKGLMYWPMCDFLTYKVIPVHLQIMPEDVPIVLLCDQDVTIQAVVHDIAVQAYCSVELFLLLDVYVKEKKEKTVI
ncbi:hypothetical protein HAX54_041922 [Datura stramonium]|uniref:Uncharacterized protein n=1 Tax=Datura stramonium TaxID=4076 RepID=A0ABS8RNQ8_DATST|nr:hypothetical protein [Datura stramonium]